MLSCTVKKNRKLSWCNAAQRPIGLKWILKTSFCKYQRKTLMTEEKCTKPHSTSNILTKKKLNSIPKPDSLEVSEGPQIWPRIQNWKRLSFFAIHLLPFVCEQNGMMDLQVISLCLSEWKFITKTWFTLRVWLCCSKLVKSWSIHCLQWHVQRFPCPARVEIFYTKTRDFTTSVLKGTAVSRNIILQNMCTHILTLEYACLSVWPKDPMANTLTTG